mgnify:CR=1 FL=1
MARILIADDHESVRNSLRAFLESQAGWRVVGEAVNGRDAVEKAERLEVDLVLLDVIMPEMDGLAAARLIRERMPKTAVIVLSHSDSPEIIRHAFAAGAMAFVAKVDLALDLIPAVQAAHHRRRFVSRSVQNRPTSSPPTSQVLG